MRVACSVMICVWLAGCAAQPWHSDPIGSTGQPSQTIEFYDASGRHTGYGRVQGGTVDLFNADSSRRGYGRGR